MAAKGSAQSRYQGCKVGENRRSIPMNHNACRSGGAPRSHISPAKPAAAKAIRATRRRPESSTKGRAKSIREGMAALKRKRDANTPRVERLATLQRMAPITAARQAHQIAARRKGRWNSSKGAGAREDILARAPNPNRAGAQGLRA